MFLNIGKQFVWLAGLALCPMLGWGQEFLVHPQSMTVCVGEKATFTSLTLGGVGVGWFINGVEVASFSLSENVTVEIDSSLVDDGKRLSTLVFAPLTPVSYSGTNVSLTLFLLGGSPKHSELAYLFYKPNQQFKVTGLISEVNEGTAQFYWNKLESKFNLTTQYLFGVYDHDGNLLANQTTDSTQITYDLLPRADDACQYLEFRVTAEQCPDPESQFIQTEGATFVYREPDIDLSPAIAAIVRFLSNQAVRASWALDSDDAFQIVLTDLESGEQSIYNSTSPLSYRPPLCGKPVNLKVSMSPVECPDQLGFTQSEIIRFTIPCPTTATEPETEVSGEYSGTQALYPSLPVLAATAATLIRYYLP